MRYPLARGCQALWLGLMGAGGVRWELPLARAVGRCSAARARRGYPGRRLGRAVLPALVPCGTVRAGFLARLGCSEGRDTPRHGECGAGARGWGLVRAAERACQAR